MNKAEHVSPNSGDSGEGETIVRDRGLPLLLKAGSLQNAMRGCTNMAMIVTDAEGIIRWINAGAEQMLGLAAADVVDLICPSDFHDAEELTARAAALSREYATAVNSGFAALVFKASRGIEDNAELTYVRRDGSRLPAIVSITALREGRGDIIGYLLVGIDNSARRHAQQELANAKAAAEKASLAKSDFLLQMSHELRTPLNVILGFAELIESGVPPPPPSQKQNLEQILVAGRYLLDLSNEILDLALIESGKVILSREPVSLGDVMLKCQAMIAPQAKKRGIRVAFPLFETACHVKADRTRLKQVLINLLLNAVKYNRPGGTVTVECNPSPLGADSIRVSVRDTGKGLTPEQLAQLFQPFNRLGQEAGQEAGTGIGLVVSKQLVEMMGGIIGADSKAGAGSVFWIELPATSAPPPLAPEGERAAVPRELDVGGSAPRSVLYVEDNPANTELVRQLIARRPELCFLAESDAILGIAAAKARQPEVILMDINLPGMSGLDAMQILHSDPATSHIPIIAVSANAMPRDIEKGLKAGFFNYVTKPIRVPQLMSALDAALDYSRALSGRPPASEAEPET
ncbi:MAG: ATP-binding protein [Betaproteobacteria bacterium]